MFQYQSQTEIFYEKKVVRKKVKKFLENLYVDDSINGANSIEEAYHFYQGVRD